MFKKIAKWTGIVLLTVAAVALAGFLYVKHNIDTRISTTYDFETVPVTIPSDRAALAKGKHLLVIKGCQDCHGNDLGGKLMIEDGAVGRLVATNLTRGKGGLPDDYTAEDWVTALRHGITPQGRPLLFMPSHETTLLSKEDMGALIAYCQQLPPVHREMPENSLGPVSYVMSYLDKMPLLSVEKIDHTLPMIDQADSSEGIAQGKYLAVSCSGCHRADFKGGEPLVPGMPPAPNLTSTGNVGKWTQDQFIRTLRTGKTPAGHQLNNEEMPWKMTAQYEEKELASLYQFFKSLH